MERKISCDNLWCDKKIEGAWYSDEEMISGKFCSVDCLETAIEISCEEDLYYDVNSCDKI